MIVYCAVHDSFASISPRPELKFIHELWLMVFYTYSILFCSFFELLLVYWAVLAWLESVIVRLCWKIRDFLHLNSWKYPNFNEQPRDPVRAPTWPRPAVLQRCQIESLPVDFKCNNVKFCGELATALTSNSMRFFGFFQVRLLLYGMRVLSARLFCLFLKFSPG